MGFIDCMKLQRKDEGADQNTNRDRYRENEDRQKQKVGTCEGEIKREYYKVKNGEEERQNERAGMG